MVRILATLSVLVWASVAGAATLPLAYRVEAKALKAAVSGTSLTLELFRDAACTQLHHSAAVTIDDLDFITQLKLFKPKGGAKQPKSAELRHTLDGVPATGPLYLKVSGTGILALGDDCQLQASEGTGRAGAALVVIDANGTIVGPTSNNAVYVKNATNGRIVLANFTTAGFLEGYFSYYESNDCSGQPIINVYPPALYREATGYADGLLYVPGLPEATTTSHSHSIRATSAEDCLAKSSPSWIFTAPNLCCCPEGCSTPFTDVFAPIETMDVSRFAAPFTLDIK